MTHIPDNLPPSFACAHVAIHHLRYHRWATQRLCEALKAQPVGALTQDRGSSFTSILGTLNHLHQADAIWFARLNGDGGAQLSSVPAVPDLSQLEETWMSLMDRYAAWAEALDAAHWERSIAYRNLQGIPYETPIWQVVFHVVNHGTGHRAQISSMLRQSGTVPPNLDLINYYRTAG